MACLAFVSVLGALLEGSAPKTPLQPATRLALRDRVINSLPPARTAPLFVHGNLHAAIEELEGLEFVPATAEYLRAGTSGSWHICAFSEPEHRSSIEAFESSAIPDTFSPELSGARNGRRAPGANTMTIAVPDAEPGHVVHYVAPNGVDVHVTVPADAAPGDLLTVKY